MDTSFLFFWVNRPQSMMVGSYSKAMFSLVRQPHYLLMWLCHFALPPALNEKFVLLHILIFGFCQSRSLVLSYCFNLQHMMFNLVTYDVRHLFMCLFAICISILVGCLFHSFAQFLIALFGFLSFKNSLHVSDTRPLSDVFCKYFLLVCGLSFS